MLYKYNHTVCVYCMAAKEDPFCEGVFWKEMHSEWSMIRDPICSVTGGMMMVMGFIPNGGEVPVLFALCKASLALVGVGTVVFHALDEDQAYSVGINYRMCDWFSIAIMCTNVTALYISNQIRQTELISISVYFTMYLWTSFLVLGIDSFTYGYWTSKLDVSGQQNNYDTVMNAVLLGPMVFVIIYTAVFHMHIMDTIYLWISFGINAGLWLLNTYLCPTNSWLFVFHAIYHVTMAYTFVYAACLGVSLDTANWTVETGFWPTITPNRKKELLSDVRIVGKSI